MPSACTNESNLGRRYLHLTCGGIVLVLSILRLTIVRMGQTPKWMIGQNRDEEANQFLQKLATRHNRSFDLTVAELKRERQVGGTEPSVWSSLRIWKHFSALFQTRKLTWSYTVILPNWLVIGMVSSLFHVFLPYYLDLQGRKIGTSYQDETWRNYAITQSAEPIGPIIAAVLIETNLLGRRGTMAVGTVLAMAFSFAYTQIRTPAENAGISSATNTASNVYYSVLFAYTPEILPTAHRATGYAVCLIVNRIGGISGVLVGSYADVPTVAPLFVVASLYAGLVVLSLILPFESRGKRTT